MKENKFEFMFFGLFLAVGIIVFVVMGGIFHYAFPHKNTIITSAEIISFEDGCPVVKYNIEREVYKVKLNESSDTFTLGKRIDIVYEKENPTFICSLLMRRLRIVFYIIPLVFSIVGGIGIGFTIKKSGRKKLVNTGRRLDATVTDVGYNRNYMVNGKNPFVIYCEFLDIDGNTYNFISGNLWQRPIIDESKKMPVYVDPNNYKIYYVNLDEYFNN